MTAGLLPVDIKLEAPAKQKEKENQWKMKGWKEMLLLVDDLQGTLHSHRSLTLIRGGARDRAWLKKINLGNNDKVIKYRMAQLALLQGWPRKFPWN
jgi:hypothetical protein